MNSFLMFCAFLLVLDEQTSQVNCQCYDLVHQYYQCKYLKMEKTSLNSFPHLQLKYKPDIHVTNNELTDQFYRKNLTHEMNFDKAMKLFHKIYNETYNCTSEFCKCASHGVIDLYGNYSVYFRNETVFSHAKNIIEAFTKKFKSKLLSFKSLRKHLEFSNDNNLTSLIQFCIDHDYSKNRLKYYRNNFTCAQVKEPDYDCYWEATVENKTLAWNGNFTSSQIAKLLLCEIKNYVNASIEEKRFCTLSYWATSYANFAWNKDMTAHVDSLLEKARTYKPQIQFIICEINTKSSRNAIEVKSKMGNYSSRSITDRKYNQVCFDSTPLRIDCEWRLTERGVLVWDWANFTYNFDNSTTHSFSANMSFLTKSPFESNKDIANEFVIKDKFGENWIHIINKGFMFRKYYYILDFNSNINVVMSTNYFTIAFPRTLLTNGLAVDGFPELDMNLDSKRKRRSIDSMVINTAHAMSCQTMCDQTKQSFITDMDSLLGSKVVYNKCINDCLLPKKDY